MGAMFLGLALTVYNAVANRWPPFQRDAYLPANLLLLGALLLVASGPLDLGIEELGLEWSPLHLIAGLGIAILAASPLFLTLRSGRWAGRIADRRVAGLSGVRFAYHVLLRVPVGTALVEEVAFRGVLYGAALDRGTLSAAILSSLFFGLWHIGPSLNLMAANDPQASARRRWGVTAVSVAVTFAAGLLLVWLRELTGSVWAGIGIHAGLNSTGTVVAALADRVRSRVPPS